MVRTRFTSPGWLMLGLALLAGGTPILAGPQTLAASGKVSATAEAVCILRAVAARHDDPKVRNPDYLAEKFVSEEIWRSSPLRSDPRRARHNPTYFFPKVRFFELDLPAMITAKRERVSKIFGAIPDRVVLVPTDFNTRPLDEVLCDAGYQGAPV
jgi:O-methyltransferase involved in polyketide biosynthesis